MGEGEIAVKAVSFLLGVIGSLLLFGGGIIAYIFQRHVQDNDKECEKNRDDHIRIFNRIEQIEDRKKH